MTREEAIKLLVNATYSDEWQGNEDLTTAYNMAISALEQQTSVTQKSGEWILADEQNKEDVENDNYRYICSKCQCSDIHAKGTIVPYCWKCGAKMVEPQESEDKE